MKKHVRIQVHLYKKDPLFDVAHLDKPKRIMPNSLGCVVDIDPPLPPHRQSNYIYRKVYLTDLYPTKRSNNLNLKVTEITKLNPQVTVTINSNRKLSIQNISKIKTEVNKKILTVVSGGGDTPMPPDRRYSRYYRNLDLGNVKIAKKTSENYPEDDEIIKAIRCERTLSRQDITKIEEEVAKRILKNGEIADADENI